MQKHKTARRASAQFYMSAEDHVENEMKHEKLLTETSRISSCWASLRLSANERQDVSDCGTSSPGSSGSSPVSHQRPHSFSGPLMISVTCSSSSCVGSVCTTESTKAGPGVCGGTSVNSPTVLVRPASCHPSPAASPVSSRVQCYSPGVGPTSFGLPGSKKRTASTSSGGSASPLLLNSTLGRKRIYPSCFQTSCSGGGGQSSTDDSRESSPDPFGSGGSSGRASKFLRSSEGAPMQMSIQPSPALEQSVAVTSPPSPSSSSPSSSSFHLSATPRTARWPPACIGTATTPTTTATTTTPSISTPSSPVPFQRAYHRYASNSPSTTSLPSPHHTPLSACPGATSAPQLILSTSRQESEEDMQSSPPQENAEDNVGEATRPTPASEKTPSMPETSPPPPPLASADN
ncbi:hypothetical protein SprV_0100491800 [Sparganum proliferum]